MYQVRLHGGYLNKKCNDVINKKILFYLPYFYHKIVIGVILVMGNIGRYQNAFNLLADRLKNNDSILAVMVFGSIITGDLWEGSDIDLFVISRDDINDIRNIYSEEEGIPVHIKLMSKKSLLSLSKEEVIGGFIHRVFVSSRLVFSKDEEITAQYDLGRYYPDIDRQKWNMVYLSDLLKSISTCKKYLHNNGTYMAYSYAVKSIEDFSKVYINSTGYMISKDVMTMAVNLNDELKKLTDNLFFTSKKDTKDIHEDIENIITFIEDTIEASLIKYVELLLEYMKEKDCFLSSEDIEKDDFFQGFKIDFEGILTELAKRDIVKKDSREYKDTSSKLLFKEKVYFL